MSFTLIVPSSISGLTGKKVVLKEEIQEKDMDPWEYIEPEKIPPKGEIGILIQVVGNTAKVHFQEPYGLWQIFTEHLQIEEADV